MRTLLAITTACLLLFAIVPSGAAERGNSENARLCQHGGWEHLQRTDGSTFKNQGACVSYAAQGGELQQIPPPRTPTIRVEQYTATDTFGRCSVNIFAEGLTPNTPYWFRIVANGIDIVHPTSSDASGNEDSAFTGGGRSPVFSYYADEALTVLIVTTAEPFHCAPVGQI